MMPCKPATLCSSLLPGHKKKKQRHADVVEPVRRNENAGKTKAMAPSSSATVAGAEKGGNPLHRSSSQVHREFIRATAGVTDGKGLSSLDALPSCEQAYSQFITSYPRFLETRTLDHLRLQEYSHLEEEELACLDYCGFGLFSHAQQDDISVEEEGFSSSFSLLEISANLWSHALFGAAQEGTMECAIRNRIMDFLNVSSAEYSIVFTASRGATFKLLADAYPWDTSPRLVTMYDYESESVGWMEQRALDCGARVYRAKFRWPSLRVCSTELKKELTSGTGRKTKNKPRRQVGVDPGHFTSSSRLTVASWLDCVSIQQQHNQKGQKKGLFVFPVQSRVSGSKFSYQWMSLAQQNQWHVLLDASCLGPKDMDSLGLSLFRPDFITVSFYKLFGSDPSGFGCLLIKNSVAQSIQDGSGALVSGMVCITPALSDWVLNSFSTSEDSEGFEAKSKVSAFSGPMSAIDEVDKVDIPSPLHLLESICDDNYSSACEDAELGSLSHSPGFSEDGHGISFPFGVSSSPISTGSFASFSVSGTLHDEPTLITIPENPFAARWKGDHLSRRRSKGLCAGLLHLHTGRVGNSGESNGEDSSVFKDALKEFPEDENNDLSFKKEQVSQSWDVIGQSKLVVNAAYGSKVQARRDSGNGGENIPERLTLVLKKIREEQVALGNGEELSLGSHFREHEKRSFVRKRGEIFHQREQEDFVDRHGGLETIEETEGDIYKSGEQDQSSRRTLASEEAKSPTTSAVLGQRDNAICRETEGGFRLLGCRDADPLSLGKILTGNKGDESFASRFIGSGGHECLSFERNSGIKSNDEQGEEVVNEPQLLCRNLDHADMMGLNKTSVRLRYLINWLVSSLLSLRHPETDLSLVKIYGPHVRYDRGASVAFNIFDSSGKLLHPDMVRMLADHINVSLGLGFLRNIHFHGNLLETHVPGVLDWPLDNAARAPSRVEVLTAALGLLSDFRDVYRLWSFVASFLDPDFVVRELGQLQPSDSTSGAA